MAVVLLFEVMGVLRLTGPVPSAALTDMKLLATLAAVLLLTLVKWRSSGLVPSAALTKFWTQPLVPNSWSLLRRIAAWPVSGGRRATELAPAFPAPMLPLTLLLTPPTR